MLYAFSVFIVKWCAVIAGGWAICGGGEQAVGESEAFQDWRAGEGVSLVKPCTVILTRFARILPAGRMGLDVAQNPTFPALSLKPVVLE